MTNALNAVDASRASEIAALDAYLHEWVNGERQVPTLDAALRDARETMQHGEALWLATLGYLIVVEMLGQAVARMPSAFKARKGSTDCFVAGAQEFAVRQISPKDARALYGLRCALAHEYGLRSANASVRHLFAVTESGSLIQHPIRDWLPITDPATGKPMEVVTKKKGKKQTKEYVWPSAVPDNTTWINIREVGVFVEELVQSVRDEHRAGNVYLASGMDAFQLRDFGQFVVS